METTDSVQLKSIGDDLVKLVEGDVLVDIYNRVAFSTDASIYQIVPRCVVSCASVGDVVNVVRYAMEKKVPVTARGAGSGLAGEALCDGIVIDTCKYMNRILGVEKDGEVVICEPGVVLTDLNDYLSKYGRKIGPDPSSGNRAVMGGVFANNATGSHSLEYGYTADYIERVEAVLYDGSLVNFSSSTDPLDESDEQAAEIAAGLLSLLEGKEDLIENAQPKTKRNRCGYNIRGICKDGKVNIARLLAGSEGTLCVFTKLAIRTVEIPKEKAVVQFEFASLEDMAKAVPFIAESGATTCELTDDNVMNVAREALPEYSDIYPENAAATLLCEAAAAQSSELQTQIDKVLESAGDYASEKLVVRDNFRMQRLWRARKDAVPLLHREKGQKHPVAFIEDVSVDINKLSEYLQGLRQLGEKYGFKMAFYGHAGDGELHIRPFMDLTLPDEVKRMRELANDVFELAWSLGGSISGEHADGLLRSEFIERQYGKEYYKLLEEVKDIFDPAGILNPGKIVNIRPDAMTSNLRFDRKVVEDRIATDLIFDANEFRWEIEQCNGDGVCLSSIAGTRMCPVFRVKPHETASTRGKVNILRGWITGLLEGDDVKSKEFSEIMGYCINCKMCSVECPSGVDVSKLVMEARAQIAKRKGLCITESALARNRYMLKAGSMFAPLSNFVTSLPIVRWIVEKVLGMDKRRPLPHFERGSFADKARGWLSEQEIIAEPVDKAVYFVDSYAGYSDHELGWAVVKSLRSLGIEVEVPEQRPAPMPAMVYGDIKTAKKDLEYNVEHLVEWVRRGYKILCSEPSAALCLKEELRLFADSSDTRLVSENSYELMSYLYDMYESGQLKIKADKESRSFVYHPPCHLISLNGQDKGIGLLDKVCGASIEKIEKGCCGLAGTCGMQKSKYELSVEIGREMAEAINLSNADYAMTECGACKMQIEHLTNKKVIHPVKVLYENLVKKH